MIEPASSGGFMTTRNLAPLGLVVSLLLLGSSALPQQTQQQTWVGYVTDTHCGTNCQVTKDMTPDLKCIRRCVQKGSKYGLWSGDKVYVLEPQARTMKFAAQSVKVSGTISGETIQIAEIKVLGPADVQH
jgi:hypothetical protein